jgi:hypothetical protein
VGIEVGAVQADFSLPVARKLLVTQPLNLKCDTLVSSKFASKFNNLYRYAEVSGNRGSIYDGQHYVAKLKAKYAATVGAMDKYVPGIMEQVGAADVAATATGNYKAARLSQARLSGAQGGDGGGGGGGGAGKWAAARSKVHAARDAELVADGNLKNLVASWKKKSSTARW